MCGRYTLAAPDPAEIRRRFPVGDSIEIDRRYNVAPADDVLAVTTDKAGSPRGEMLRWGLVPSWSKAPGTSAKMINARVETVDERPAYRRAFERFRCLIVADGFYEWQLREDGRKQPFHITRRDGAVFAFAGLWSIWHGEGDEQVRSCTILTTAANELVVPLHDRMPVILAPNAEGEWLDSSTPRERLFEIAGGLGPDEMSARAVGTAVNDARYDGPECLEPPVPSPQAQLF